MHPVTASPLPTLRRATTIAAAIATALSLGACSTIDGFLTGDKIDYKSQAAKTAPLEVPPDLTQLQRDGRYVPQSSGTVSASSFGGAAAATAATASAGSQIAPAAIGDMRIVREGSQRYLAVPIPADKLWPQLRSFWQERGFSLVIDNPEAGVMETDWAENRAKIPQDLVRRTLGRVLDSLYDTGERDRFRVRVERTAAGSDVFISHRGMVEIYTGDRKESTTWTQRPSDPQLEAEFLSRLMVKLGVKEEVARTVATAAPVTSAPRARQVGGQPAATLQVDEAFDRAWRRVGLTLDRSGFTVEDRDRAGGLYFVRYVDPKDAATAEPSFFAKLFNFGKSDAVAPGRYRIAVKGDGERTNVSVQNAQGGPENGAVGQRIVGLLVEDLK